MPRLSRSMLLGAVVMAAVVPFAYGQSVSTLTPNGGLPSSASPPPAESASRLPGPNAGVNINIPNEPKSQTPSDLASNPASHPYSVRGYGPTPDAASSGTTQHYEPPPGYSSDTSQHPYSSGSGPRPN
jgi:hypothetical protein